MAGEAVVGADTPGVRHDGPIGALEDLGRLLRSGAGVVLDAAADERTTQVLDRVAGSQWRWVARAASVAAVAAREAMRAREENEADANGAGVPPGREERRAERAPDMGGKRDPGTDSS